MKQTIGHFFCCNLSRQERNFLKNDDTLATKDSEGMLGAVTSETNAFCRSIENYACFTG